MIEIRAFAEPDWDDVWAIIEPVFRASETYCFPPDISKDEAYAVWVNSPLETFVAFDEAGALVGTYYIVANKPAQGSHVCNCGYIVSSDARGKGMASAMCTHSQEIARDHGFRDMQYNFVVASNEGAVRLWQQHDFKIVGTLPKAFEHPRLGFVDAYVMHKHL